MSVQRLVRPSGAVRYRARGEVPRPGGRDPGFRAEEGRRSMGGRSAPVSACWRVGRSGSRPGVALGGCRGVDETRRAVKRKTMEADLAAWKWPIEPRFGRVPVASITAADVAKWVGLLAARDLAPSTDPALPGHAALAARLCRGGRQGGTERGREGEGADRGEGTAGRTVPDRGRAGRPARCLHGAYADVVLVLGLGGLRWGEVAGLRVGDRVQVPGAGLRLQRAVLASSSKAGSCTWTR